MRTLPLNDGVGEELLLEPLLVQPLTSNATTAKAAPAVKNRVR
mgnify:FL=1